MKTAHGRPNHVDDTKKQINNFILCSRWPFHPLSAVSSISRAVARCLSSVDSLLTKVALENALAVEWNDIKELNLSFLEGTKAFMSFPIKSVSDVACLPYFMASSDVRR